MITTRTTPPHPDDRHARWSALRALFPESPSAPRLLPICAPVIKINLATNARRVANRPAYTASPTVARQRGTISMEGGVEIIDTQNRKYAGNVNRGRNEFIRYRVRAVGCASRDQEACAPEVMSGPSTLIPHRQQQVRLAPILASILGWAGLLTVAFGMVTLIGFVMETVK